MASDSPFDAVRRFYQEGGFVDAPAPNQGPSDRLKRLEALYGSQHFAEGGNVQEFSEGGKFAPIIQALKQSLARSVRTPSNTYRTDEAIDKIHNLWGIDQARRLEEAADRGVDLSHYQPRALERATNPDAGYLFSTMHPSKFQDFAAKIPDEFMERADYPLAELSNGKRSLEQILREYSDIAKMPGEAGWSHVPELHIGPSLSEKSLGNGHFVPPLLPEVKQHNGRHRNMALDMFAPLDIAPDSNRSLVTLVPSGKIAGIPGDPSNQEKFRKFLAQYDNRIIPEPEGLNYNLHSRYLSEATLPQLETPFRDGGDVPGYAGGGAQIMRKGFDRALEPILEYLGGLKRNPIQYHPEQTREFSPHYSTAYQHDPNDNWKTAMDKGRFPVQLDEHPDAMTDAMRAYTSSDYHDFNAALRSFAENKTKDLNQDSTFPYGHEWWRTGKRDNTATDYREQRIAGQASDLAKYLQDMEYELPFDVFRGSRTRVVPDLLSDADPAQVHGRGFGSFTFRPEAGLEWGSSTPAKGYGTTSDVLKVPSTLRIPQGTKVRGANVMPYSEMDNEFEMLLAPFQGFDVTDVNLLHSPKGRSSYYPDDLNRLLLDIEPSNSYNPYSPQIYRDGGSVEGYADGGKLGKLIQYMRGISQPIRAHHGSPHDFDKFDSSMIGKGEGNQTYGHGLYFAENPDIAKWYRDTLAGDPDKVKPDQIAQQTIDARWQDLIQQRRTIAPDGYVGKLSSDQRNLYSDMQAEMDRLHQWAVDDTIKRNPWAVKGRMYDVNIHEDPSKFLSLDMPFNVQGDTGQRGFEAMRKLDSNTYRSPDRYFNSKPSEFDWHADPTFAKEASANEIPGIRYLDGRSREKGQGTHNYVTFPGMDDLIEITRKYADGGAVPGYNDGGPYGVRPRGKFGALRSYVQAFQDIINRPITVAVDDRTLPKVVADGRFKSQFETGYSNGSYDPEYRAKWERDAFGLPLDLPVDKRPIYGHIADRDTLESGRSYGQWGAVLDPKVNERSTFYFGDSLGTTASPHGPYPFKPIREPEVKNKLWSFIDDNYTSQYRAEFQPRNLKGLLAEGNTPGGYVEAQIHNGLPWSDVRALVGKKEYGHPDDAAAAMYKAAQISNRPVFAPWSKFDRYDRDLLEKARKAGTLHPDTVGELEMKWMRADPHEDLNNITGVPASALAEFGYEDGGQTRHLMTGYDGQFYNEGGEVEGYAGGGLRKLATAAAHALRDVRPATEDIHDVISAGYPYGRYAGNRTVPTEQLYGGTGNEIGDLARVDALKQNMASPEGYFRRMIADDSGNVVEGQHRLDAARGLEFPKVPVHLIQDMSLGYDLPAMESAVRGLHPDQTTQMIREALDGLRLYGRGALDELHMPGRWDRPFKDAIEAAGPRMQQPVFKEDGGEVDHTIDALNKLRGMKQ